MADSVHFPLLGEPLSLDLLNTVVRRDGAERDLLDSPAALAAWLHAQSARLTWSGVIDVADLQAVRRFRTTLAELFVARREGRRPGIADLRQLNAALSPFVPAARLAWSGAGPKLVMATRSGTSKRKALLQLLAADAVAVLTGPSAALLRDCAHPDCVLQFVASNPRRRWCSPSVCGNRARVARHYQRQRSTH